MNVYIVKSQPAFTHVVTQTAYSEDRIDRKKTAGMAEGENSPGDATQKLPSSTFKSHSRSRRNIVPYKPPYI